MTDILDRIRSRIHDAPIPVEHLLDDAGDAIEDLRGLLDAALSQLNGLQDEGPEGQGWQSAELVSLIERGRAALG